MKKFLILLTALMMLLALVPAVSAAEGQMVDGDNEMELKWDVTEPSVYTYTATQTGTLYIMATKFCSAYKSTDYSDNSGYMYEWFYYTELTVDGQLLTGDYYGTIEVVEGQTYTFCWKHIGTGNWGWYAVLNLSYSDEHMPVAGTPEYPVQLRPDVCPTDSIVIPAGEEVYYTLYDFDGSTFTVSGPGAYVTFSALDDTTALMKEFLYEAEDGILSAPIGTSYLKIRIGNNSDTQQVYQLNYFYPAGTERNPVPLTMGKNVAVTKADDYNGYYFSWTAEEDCILYLTFGGENGWRYRVRNLTTGMRGEEVLCTDENAENPAQIWASKGDKLLIIVNSFRAATMSIPGGEVLVSASVGHQHAYGDGEVANPTETCQDEGRIIYTCKICGEQKVETFRGAHMLEKQEAGYAATCALEGCRPYWYCGTCQTYFRDEAMTEAADYADLVIPATGRHTDADGEWEYEAQGHYHTCACGKILDASIHTGGTATCTTRATCGVCGEEYGDLDSDNHPETQIRGQIPETCATEGYTGDTYCITCGEKIADGTAIPATGNHADVDGEWNADELRHFLVCQCGYIIQEQPHSGGTATCTEKAICELCHVTYGQLDGTNHLDTEIRGAFSETCATDGYTGDTYCTACNEKVADGEVIPANGNHADVDGEWNVNETGHFLVCQCGYLIQEQAHSGGTANCAEKAVCQVCHAAYGQLDGDNHPATEIRGAFSETCANDGYSGDAYCTVCNKKVADGTMIPANGNHTDVDGIWEYDAQNHWHTCSCTAIFDKSAHNYGAWEILKEAGEEEGLMRRTCDCGHYEESVIPAQHTHQYDAVITAPDCYQNGYTTYTCACGYAYVGDEVPGGHKTTESSEGYEPACEKTGMMAYWYCGVCQTYFVDVLMSEPTTWEALIIPALEHVYDAEVTAPGCYENGYTTYTCGICGEAYTDDEVAAGHQNVQQAQSVAPTCTEPGRKAYWHCQTCNVYFTDEALTVSATWDELTIPAAGHAAGEWVVVKEASVGVAGLRQRICNVCGVLMEEEQIPALENPPVPTTAPSQPTAPNPTTTPNQTTAPAQTTEPNQTTAPGGEQRPAFDGGTMAIVIALALAAAIVVVIIVMKKKHS